MIGFIEITGKLNFIPSLDSTCCGMWPKDVTQSRVCDRILYITSTSSSKWTRLLIPMFIWVGLDFLSPTLSVIHCEYVDEPCIVNGLHFYRRLYAYFHCARCVVEQLVDRSGEKFRKRRVTRVQGHSRSSNLAPIEKVYAISYYWLILTSDHSRRCLSAATIDNHYNVIRYTAPIRK